MIREAFLSALQNRPARKPTTDLYVSDLGMHPYKAMARILNGERSQFEPSVLEKMECGTAFEENTAKLVSQTIPTITQFPLWNRLWSGYADMVIGHNTDQVFIVEHKATDTKAWGYIPKSTHICQLWMYGQLYEELYSVKPQLILVYRSWGQLAEFDVTVSPSGVVCSGFVGNARKIKEFWISPAALRTELENYYEGERLPSPDGADTWDYPEEAFNRLAVCPDCKRPYSEGDHMGCIPF